LPPDGSAYRTERWDGPDRAGQSSPSSRGGVGEYPHMINAAYRTERWDGLDRAGRWIRAAVGVWGSTPTQSVLADVGEGFRADDQLPPVRAMHLTDPALDFGGHGVEPLLHALHLAP